VIARVALLAGGTGGAKLAAGLQELLGADLSVIANTADDTEVVGVRVSPDPDLITYWLADEIDEQRGWGIRGDRFEAFERLVRLGAPDWFRLSDRDLATCLYRTYFMNEGGRHTDAQRQIAERLGVLARVLPMCEERVTTRVRTADGWREFQEYLILDRAEPAVEEVAVDGIEEASPTPEVLEAIEGAEAIVIGPSNPVVSIGPILAVPGLVGAIRTASAPVLAVSPFVAGRAVKGPTELFMSAVGRPASASGVVSLYEGLLDGLIVDADDPEPPPREVPTLLCPTLMEGARGRRRLAERTLEFASDLASAS
jgi:LPPG:FO 2-phospho-L-lactate transferase